MAVRKKSKKKTAKKPSLMHRATSLRHYLERRLNRPFLSEKEKSRLLKHLDKVNKFPQARHWTDL